MSAPNHQTCEYCGSGRPVGELELRNDRIVCIDTKACDERDHQRHRDTLADLRRRQRAGDELTEAEKLDLADG